MATRPIPDLNQVQSLSDLGNLHIYKGHPSPTTWRDEIMYFMLPDRFSNGQEDQGIAYDIGNPDQYTTEDLEAWRNAGDKFQGGTIQGVMSKLDYLKALGVTTLWLGPVYKQRQHLNTYHGYGIQHFLEVDPRFGTREDLVELVKAAHEKGLRVIMDIIYNHTGDNWSYNPDGNDQGVTYGFNEKKPLGSWRSGAGSPTQSIESLEDGVWPKDFQQPSYYTRMGPIHSWTTEAWEDPLHNDVEFRRGDFCTLKDLDLMNPSVLKSLIRVYQYWMEITDCDGFRIDTVKHVPFEASRIFCGAIREYAEMIGKNSFLLLGEVGGDNNLSYTYLEIFGRNLDAVLDINGVPTILSGVAKGQMNPSELFNQYHAPYVLGAHREAGRYHVSVLDDHDKITGDKSRFSASNDIPDKYSQVAHAVGIQLTILGIPCIYYGTEQAFAGTYRDNPIDGYVDGSDDRYLREAMFPCDFGGFYTTQCHFFNGNHPTYMRIAAISAIRQRQDIIGLVLRRGRQYLRETSVVGNPYGLPSQGEIIPWSRIMGEQEVLVVLNSNGVAMRGAKITLNGPFYNNESKLTVMYQSDWTDEQIKNHDDFGPMLPVEFEEDGRAFIHLTLPPAGMMILSQINQ